MPNKKEYPYIRAWGQLHGSLEHYIKTQIAQAQKDDAPDDATYKKGDGWRRFTDVTSTNARRRLNNIINGE